MSHLFPPESFDISPFSPLSHKAILRDLLIPEAVVLLIQSDLNIARDGAITVYLDSQQYGTYAHQQEDDFHVELAAKYWRDQQATALTVPNLSVVKEEQSDPQSLTTDIEDGEIWQTAGGEQWVVTGNYLELVD